MKIVTASCNSFFCWKKGRLVYNYNRVVFVQNRLGCNFKLYGVRLLFIEKLMLVNVHFYFIALAANVRRNTALAFIYKNTSRNYKTADFAVRNFFCLLQFFWNDFS